MTLWVILRVLLSTWGNALQKRLLLGGGQVLAVWRVTYLLMLVPALGILVVEGRSMPAEFWVNAMLGGFLDGLGNLAMLAALQATDLSIFGPLNGFRPVLALLFGWVILHERPSPMGLVGVAITLVGVVFLFRGGQGKPMESRAVRHLMLLRGLGLTLSTFSASFLKKAANTGSAGLTLAVWILCGLGALGLWQGWLRWSETKQGRPPENPVPVAVPGWRKGLLLHAALFFAMQWITLRIFQETLLGYSFVYFQAGMILQVLLGRLAFGEPYFRRRLAACLIIAAGAGLVAWKG